MRPFDESNSLDNANIYNALADIRALKLKFEAMEKILIGNPETYEEYEKLYYHLLEQDNEHAYLSRFAKETGSSNEIED